MNKQEALQLSSAVASWLPWQRESDFIVIPSYGRWPLHQLCYSLHTISHLHTEILAPHVYFVRLNNPEFSPNEEWVGWFRHRPFGRTVVSEFASSEIAFGISVCRAFVELKTARFLQ